MEMEIDENLLSLERGITEEETRALAERKRQHLEQIEQERAQEEGEN